MSLPERSNRDKEWFGLGKSAKDYPKDWIVIPVILAIEREAKEIRNVREEERSLCNKNFKQGREELLRDNKEVEVRVRDETLNEVFKEQDERLYKLSNELKLISKVKRNSLEDCVHQYQKICKSFYKYLKITEETKKRFLVKSEEELLLKKEDKKVLCIGCGKPIHINEFGGLNNKGCFHNNVSCLIKIKKSESKEEIEVQKE